MEDVKYTEDLSMEELLSKISATENFNIIESQKREHINRTCFGWGVVYGLKVECRKDGICIGDGLAFDINGKEICLPEEKFLNYVDIFQGWEPDEGSWGLCLSEKNGFHLDLKGSREENDICIAILHTGWHGPRLLVEGIDSPVDNFHRAGNIYPEEKWEHGSFSMNLNQKNISYSREIEHRLGNGNVQIVLEIKGFDDGRECMLLGDIPGIRYGVKVFPESGTFVAFFRSEDLEEKFLQIEWFAHKLL